MLLKEGWLCWLDMVGSAGEKPKAAGWQRVEEGGLHPELLPLLAGFRRRCDWGKKRFWSGLPIQDSVGKFATILLEGCGFSSTDEVITI